MTADDRAEIEDAMKHSLLLDRGSGVYWDFDFKKEEFRVGTACNVGLLVDFTMKYDGCERVQDQLCDLAEKAEEFYDDQEEGAGA